MFLSIGILSSWSRGYSDAFLSGQDLLAAMSSSPVSNGASLAASYLFPIVALLSGIPVFSIIVRYNLMENGVGKVWANFWAVFFPWAAALCVYSGSLLNNVTTCVHLSPPPPPTHLVGLCCRMFFFVVMIQRKQVELSSQLCSFEFFTSSCLLH
jgi:hypothetical protein